MTHDQDDNDDSDPIPTRAEAHRVDEAKDSASAP
jgi:hypothetical protein